MKSMMRRLYRHPQGIFLAAVIIAAAAGGFLRFSAAAPSSAGDSSQPSQQPRSSALQELQAPLGELWSVLKGLGPLAGLRLPQSGEGALAELPAGRLDPFAPVLEPVDAPAAASTPTLDPTSVQPSQAITVSASPAQPLPNTPIVPPIQLPPLPAPNWGPPAAPLPTIPVGVTPSAVPPALSYLPALNPAEAIEVSGVLQLGDRTGIIVRETPGKTSRHVFPGDVLSNGQVVLKSIDMSSPEPVVILEYQGQEYPRIVGTGGGGNVF